MKPRAASFPREKSGDKKADKRLSLMNTSQLTKITRDKSLDKICFIYAARLKQNNWLHHLLAGFFSRINCISSLKTGKNCLFCEMYFYEFHDKYLLFRALSAKIIF